jgi:putative hydrolase of the HAD superfamily
MSAATSGGARRFDAVIFDFSGVIVASAFDAMFAVTGGDLDRVAALELMVGPYDRDTDHPWHRAERGEVPITEWITHVMAEADHHGMTVDWDAFRSMLGNLDVHDVVVDRIRALRSDGYLTALLTNNVREGAGHWDKLVPVDELFDTIVDSSAEGMRKPDPRIYELVLERLGGVPPARAVFLDDHPGNIAGAERAGITSILVADPADAVAELDGLLARAG